MSQINKIIIKAVLDAGNWGVLRNHYISPEIHEKMAEMVGMKTQGAYQFRYQFFADGVKDLNPKAMTAISMMFGIDRSELEAINNHLTAAETYAAATEN